MKHRLYWQLFLSTAAVVLVGFALLTGMIALVLSSVNAEKQMDALRSQANAIATSLSEVDKAQNYSDEIKRMASAFSESNGTTVFFVQRSGLVSVCSDTLQHKNCPHTGLVLNQDVLDAVFMSGRYEETGLFFGTYADTHHTVGVPIYASSGNYDAAVFVSARAAGPFDGVSAVLKPLGAVLAVLLAVIFFVIFLICRRVARPMLEISEATKAMANGDFSRRVKVERSDEVGELARHFNSMADALASLDSMSNSFVTNVSHDLKTPMTTIAGFVDGILDGTIPPQEHRRYLTIVSDEIKRLSGTVNTMLSLSKIQSGLYELSLQPVDLSEVAVQAVVSFEHALSEKRIDVIGLDSLPPANVSGDGQLLYQALYNLVDNAVKFTPPGGYISFSLSENNTAVELYIKNSGIGISEQEQQCIFERFYKTDKSRSEDKRGAGVGLFIVKTIADMHGGAVTVKSLEGQYTQFCLRLPRSHKS